MGEANWGIPFLGQNAMREARVASVAGVVCHIHSGLLMVDVRPRSSTSWCGHGCAPSVGSCCSGANIERMLAHGVL